ncbi:class I SAM-dependent methyltransferase [Streptomyces sp. A7024]|uniref:Class I SAM-dependent methyltransferase n=2 Tax=Streptomyces coryli TaxID=1128680 RepID=A0A6G4TVB3_9ACTN|nr:class I SAM-dependent methyltransferase [Streptomyces coryli]
MPLRGKADPEAPGALGHPGAYEVLSKVLFLGRRRRLYGQLVALAGVGAGDRVLDIGCGPGYLTRLAARSAGPRGAAVGIDPSEEMTRYAARHTKEPNCTFRKGLGEDLDLADDSFDAVVTSLAVHHIPEDKRERAVAEMYRVLRPGGRVLIADFRPHRQYVETAGFAELTEGGVRPFLHYVRGVKPPAAA